MMNQETILIARTESLVVTMRLRLDEVIIEQKMKDETKLYLCSLQQLSTYVYLVSYETFRTHCRYFVE